MGFEGLGFRVKAVRKRSRTRPNSLNRSSLNFEQKPYTDKDLKPRNLSP